MPELIKDLPKDVQTPLERFLTLSRKSVASPEAAEARLLESLSLIYSLKARAN